VGRRLFILNVLTTKLSSLWDFLINTQIYTHVTKFKVIVPELVGVGILFNCTVSQLVDENMEDFIRGAIEAHSNLLSLICIVADGFTHGVESCEWHTTHEHLKFGVTSGGNVFTKDAVLLLDLDEFLGFLGLGEYP
jgi:hypothetical protein